MDERLKFVARLLDGEKMAVVCRELGSSRVTGYKIFNRYKDCGLDGLQDRSRRPYRHANKLPFQIERTIARISNLGCPKDPREADCHGLVKRRKKRRYRATGTPLSKSNAPNDLWGADYKGEFMLGNKHYCYPLSISDYCSRFVLGCEGQESTRSSFAFTVFEQVFKEYGVPWAIGTANGQVRYQLKTPYRDGTTQVIFNRGGHPPLDFLARLAALVPRPRVNLTRFHGVFAASSAAVPFEWSPRRRTAASRMRMPYSVFSTT
jgi:hypothetical protein